MNIKHINCPECKTRMKEVRTSSHYGIPVILDQCDGCGGIWFDENELFRTKQGMAKKIDKLVDGGNLREITPLTNKNLNCPRDGMKLKTLSDQYFPGTIQAEVCPACQGFWFNRGEFVGFQKERKKRIIKHKRRSKKETEARFSKELSSQISAALALDSSFSKKQNKKKKEDTIGMIVYILWILFRYLMRR